MRKRRNHLSWGWRCSARQYTRRTRDWHGMSPVDTQALARVSETLLVQGLDLVLGMPLARGSGLASGPASGTLLGSAWGPKLDSTWARVSVRSSGSAWGLVWRTGGRCTYGFRACART